MAMTNEQWAEYQRRELHLPLEKRNPELRPDPRIPIPGIDRVEAPKMDYQVREDGEWFPVESGAEIEGGVLRYIKDGCGKTATPGNWRGVMSTEWALQQEKYSKQQLEDAKKILRRRVLLGAFIAVALLLLFLSAMNL